MADAPDEKRSNEKPFMREKIVKPPLSRRQNAVRVFRLFLSAVIFGVVAAISFAASRPLAERFLGKEPETTPAPTITIERDEPGKEEETQTAESESLPPESQSEAAREEIEGIVKKELETFDWTRDKVEGMNQVLQEIGREADQSVVTVSSVKHQVDWFDNPVESTGQYAGIILSISRGEIMILTEAAAVEEADSLRVVFKDGGTAAGTLKQKDSLGGLAVVSVAEAEVQEAVRERIKAVELGNSYSLETGDLVIAVGSPAGIVHSVKQGAVSYVAGNVQTADGQTRVLYTDCGCETGKGTFFLNMSGELVGWATELYGAEDRQGFTIALPVSEYKGNLQKLMNGIKIPYMGLKGQDVSEAMQAEGIPKGLYITEAIADSPAYLAGIQAGDILTRIQGAEICSIRDYQACLEDQAAGTEATVTVQRMGLGEYKEIEYKVIIGAR